MSKFFLYYDKETGTIKGLSGAESEELQHCAVTRIDQSLAMDFITGKLNVGAWLVLPTSTYDEPTLTQNQFDMPAANTGEIVAIPRASKTQVYSMAIMVTIYTASKVMVVTIPDNMRNTKLNHIKATELEFFLTKRNDPSYVIKEFTVSLDKLLAQGSIAMEYKSDITDFSVYTSQVFRYYQLEVSKAVWNGKVKNRGKFRFNRLVPYTPIKSEEEATSGIVAAYDINNHTLSIKIVEGSVEFEAGGNSTLTLYLTKFRDPTVLIETLKCDFKSLFEQKHLVITLPDHVGQNFGIGSYPYADQLSFLRK